jgi:tripartite-type tricarboxylate transporter receptor subunit TctC
MRQFNRNLCVLGLLCLALMGLNAQNYPSKPITIVAPFSPGGNVDIIARSVAQSLSVVLGQSVVVDNRAGAGGAIGSSFVSKSAPDGYTLLLATTNTISVLPYMMKTPPYKPSDFQAISLAAVSPLVMVVRADDKRFASTPSLIASAKAGPKNISVGHSGMGTSNHVSVLRLENVAKVEFNVIPYKGSTPALTDLMGGQIDFMIDQLSSSKSFVDAGKLKILAILSKERDDTIPNVPTFFEATKITLEANTTSGVLAPPDTPPNIVKILNDALITVAQDPVYITRLLSVGSLPKSSSPKEWAELLRQESLNSERLALAGKLKVE